MANLLKYGSIAFTMREAEFHLSPVSDSSP